MILSNYWKWLNGILTTNPTSSSYYDPSNDIGLKNLNGATALISLGSSDDTRRYRNRNINDGSIRLGSGSGDITASDYSMSDDCTSSVSNLSFTVNSAGTDEGLSRTISVSGQNSSGAELTITEVGYCKFVSTEQDGDNNVLICKTKLNTPLTVSAGGNFLINVSWNEA